jgi:hypothetical protein
MPWSGALLPGLHGLHVALLLARDAALKMPTVQLSHSASVVLPVFELKAWLPYIVRVGVRALRANGARGRSVRRLILPRGARLAEAEVFGALAGKGCTRRARCCCNCGIVRALSTGRAQQTRIQSAGGWEVAQEALWARIQLASVKISRLCSHAKVAFLPLIVAELATPAYYGAVVDGLVLLVVHVVGDNVVCEHGVGDGRVCGRVDGAPLRTDMKQPGAHGRQKYGSSTRAHPTRE